MESKVTVLTPCYNGETYVRRYFDSLLGQTYKNIEIVFVDDGSFDSTKNICDEYSIKFKNRNIDFKYVYQENGGQSAACNNGLKHVTGKYLVWPDADDWYDKDAIKKLASFLDSNNNYQAVRGYAEYIDEDTMEVLEVKKPVNFEREDLFLDYLVGNKNVYCLPGVMMINFDYFKEANKGLDIQVSSGGQNWQIIFPVVYKGKCKYIDEKIYNYLVRKNSHSHVRRSRKDMKKREDALKSILDTVLEKIVDDRENLSLYKEISYKRFTRKVYKDTLDKKIKRNIKKIIKR